MREYNVYIDESGDEGINKGSKYFILTAVIVEKKKDLEISKSIDKIKENLELNIKTQLHWNSIRGKPNKCMVLNSIVENDITIINVIIDTYSIKFIKSNKIYYYFSAYLYERICWFMSAKNGVANIIISTRGQLKKEELLNFLKENNNDKFSINTKYINNIKLVPNEKKKLLQMADSCCSSLFQFLKYNDESTKTYINILKPRIFNQHRKYIGYGIKIVPKTIINGTNKVIENLINIFRK